MGMFGPDTYEEETPELLAAIDELLVRLDRIQLIYGGQMIGDGVRVVPTYSHRELHGLQVSDLDGLYVEVNGRRAYTKTKDGSIYADPDLIFNHVLPTIRQHQVLDDIVDATKEPPMTPDQERI